jgi:hypothetical protein
MLDPAGAMMQPSTSFRYLGAVAALGLLTLALLASTARAEITRTGSEPWYQQPAADIRRAKELFARAVSEHQQLKRGDARDLYDQALALWDNPDIRWNLALVLEDLGQYLRAHHQLESASRWGEALGAERLRDIRDRMTALETHLARIDASCKEPATDITLDGQPWFHGSGQQSTLVEPGEHYVFARKAGFFPITSSILVAAGQVTRLDLAMLTHGPATCAEIATTTHGPRHDGEYVLYFDGSLSKPWVAYCLGMNSAKSREYLQLIRTKGANFSQYNAGGLASGTSVRSSYTKVRIDPITLLVDTKDETFASSNGFLRINGSLLYTIGDIINADDPLTSTLSAMGYAIAGSCDTRPSGVANIDLQGTPFTIPHNVFTLTGFRPVGAATFSANDQVVNITGGGSCGVNTPMLNDGLQLKYP